MIECRAPKTKKELAQYYQLRWLILRAPWGQEQGSEVDELEKQAFHRCLFDREGQIIAVGRLHFTDQYKAQIRYMAVSEKQQGQGLGKQLIESLESVAQARGAQEIMLHARENSIPFYQRLGYQTQAKSHLLYGKIQHVKMLKPISGLAAHQAEISNQLQSTWHQTIPLSKAMNIDISYFDGEQLLTNCDPAFNKNLHNTMFAGSIYTLATLTGWGWVYLLLKKYNLIGDIVLAEASIKYLAPIAGVVCAKSQATQVVGDLSLLQSKRKVRISVQVDVCSGDRIAATFNGEYAVITKENKTC